MRKTFLSVAVAAAAIVAIAGPARAITNGEFDGEDHPQVVLVVADVVGEGAPGWRCTGTMLNETMVLTAGHCTSNHPYDGVITGMRIFTESDVDNGDNSYPNAGSENSIEAAEWASHPAYEDAPFFVNDVGMIELEEPYELEDEYYAELPEIDSLDDLARRRGKNKAWFTAVGYGLQRINPVFIQAERVRMVAYPKLNQINVPGFTGDFSLLLSNNHATGGTCFGDSGGANFLRDTNVIAGITSFGINGNCAGTGGVFRTDRQNVQDFIKEFMVPAAD